MPASTSFSYHVAGPIVPSCNIGSSGAFLGLGICEEGARITLQVAQSDVKHDGGGGTNGFETENIFLNAIVLIQFKLVPFGGTQVNRLRALQQASPLATDGVMVVPGTLYGTNGLLPSLFLPSSDTDGPWWFRYCRVVRAGDNTVHTKESKPEFEFRCINWFNPSVMTSIATNTLYSRTTPP